MRTETLYLGSREEIAELVKGHREFFGVSLESQLDQIESVSNKTGIIFMLRNIGSGGQLVDKWFVQIRDFEKEMLDFKEIHRDFTYKE